MQVVASNLPDSCRDRDFPSLPKGTYLNQLCPGGGTQTKCTSPNVKIARESDSPALVYKETHINDICKYVEVGFDIQLFGDRLGLKPGHRITLKEYQEKAEVQAFTKSYTWLNVPAWLFMPASRFIAIDTPEDIPDTCSTRDTFVLEEAALLETRCRDVKQIYRHTVIPHCFSCDINEGFRNLNGQLACSYSLLALLDYYLQKTSLSYLGVDRSECEAAKGTLTFFNISYFAARNSGFALCINNRNKKPAFLGQLTLPPDYEFVGYDALLDLMITRQVATKGRVGYYGPYSHYQALYKPSLCHKMGLSLEAHEGGLYCTPLAGHD